MEAKLKEYRALRRRKELIESAKETLEKSKQKVVDFLVPKIFTEMHKEKDEDEVLLMENEHLPEPAPVNVTLIQPEDPSEVASDVSEHESLTDETQESWRYFILKWSLYAIIWLSLFMYFLKLQFGAVFFVISVLIGIYLNTRTRPKKKGEVSAYSVFNQNCVSINGTLKAEQFEREIRYGAGSVRTF